MVGTIEKIKCAILDKLFQGMNMLQLSAPHRHDDRAYANLFFTIYAFQDLVDAGKYDGDDPIQR